MNRSSDASEGHSVPFAALCHALFGERAHPILMLRDEPCA